MFIDFEGIDGSGKTTLSNRLAQRLKALGYRVTHAREGGELQSAAARRIRELTRDSSLLELCPEAEFFLNLARDAQQRAELVAPALARGEVCITDRYLPSQLSLSGSGRGLSLDALMPAAQLAAGGVWPDLVIFIDVDPDLARLRKRLAKAAGGRSTTGDSRKGLAGATLTTRMREGFLAQARREPGRWLVVENDAQPLEVLEGRILEVVLERLGGRLRQAGMMPAAAQAGTRSSGTRGETERRVSAAEVRPVERLADVEPRFLDTLDGLAVREPALALWLLTGVPGARAQQRRLRAVEALPGVVAHSLTGLLDEDSMRLRALLAGRCPAQVAESLGSAATAEAMALRARLYPHAPAPVLSGLRCNDSAEAWSLRERALDEKRLAEVLPGLAGLEDARAWSLRDGGAAQGLASEVARSLSGMASERADALRERLFPVDRLAVLRSTTGLDTPFAWRTRHALFAAAPKVVLRSLTGLACARADAMREAGAEQTKEALDAVDGLDTPASWHLRERYLLRYPSTVVNSLRGLPVGPAAEALVLRALAAFPTKLALLRGAYLLVRGDGQAPAQGAQASLLQTLQAQSAHAE